MMRTGLQHVCKEILDGTDGAIGCALVDLETGLPLTLEVKPGAPLNPVSMELLSAMGVSYFDGGSSLDFNDESSEYDDAVQEIQTTTEDACYFMARVPGSPQELLILVTDPNAINLGLGWMSMRQALAQVQTTNADNGQNGTMRGRQTAPHQMPDQPADQVFARRARTRRSIWD